MEQDINKRSLSTSNSKEEMKFIVKFLIGFFVLTLYINSLLPQYSQECNASLIDKVKRLESITEPKIVLIGNSNLAWGIDSQLLETEMGMPVVNMGLHGGLMNAFHEEMTKLNVREGDIYIICHTDYNDNNGIGAELAWVTVENHFHLWNLLRFSDIKEMVKSFPVYLKKSLTLASSGMGNRIPNSLYARKTYNEYGDIGALCKGNFYKSGYAIDYLPTVGSVTIDRINELNRYLMEKGATLLIAGFPIRNGSRTHNSSKYVLFQKELSARLDCPVISNYVDYMFDYRYFFNSNWHLNSEGAKLRTVQLISDLKNWMESDSETNIPKNSYEDIVADVNLPHVDDYYKYVDLLNQGRERYSIFISFKNNSSLRMNTEILDKLKVLGVSTTGLEELKNNFVAVLENGVAIEERMQSGKIEISGVFDNGNMKFSIMSDGQNKEVGSSILLNGEEYSENVNGFNFVVYSNETHRRLDEVGFDFSSTEPKAHRFTLK